MKIEIISYIKNHSWNADAYACDNEKHSDLKLVGKSTGMATRKAAEDAAILNYKALLKDKLDSTALIDVQFKTIEILID